MASQKQLAAHLGVTPRRVRQMVDEGVIPGPDAKGSLISTRAGSRLSGTCATSRPGEAELAPKI
jgi:DNA-binding transcriptional regulator YdaS (Cro superfamily)